ncbi:hypothetical protein M422DRAFT_149594 [Sphaerobolus stellatus SS14]|nr:hypothetical protein M422DRAFT_149594 [Sphaerobolus stellatus SS14]
MGTLASSYLYYTCILAAAAFVYYFLKDRHKLPLPPGPKSLPLIGNAFDLPTSHEYLKYADWGSKYGDVVHVTALGKHIIILNSTKACIDLLEQRSTIHSDRPSLPMIDEPTLIDAGWSFSTMRYSKRWKRHRRLFTHHLNPTAITQVFSERQVSAVQMLLRLLVSNPKTLKKNLMHVSANLLLGIAYGYTVQSGHDPIVELAEETMAKLTNAFQPKYLVNVFPIMKYTPTWFPGAGWKHFAQYECRPLARRLLNEPFDEALEEIARGKASASFIQQALTDRAEGRDPNAEEDIKQVAATMYAAGSDTTVAVIHALILQLILHPEIQKRVHRELDSVLGSPDSAEFRLPIWEDRSRTPYLEALIKEILRWNPAVGSGVPHAAMEEDEYRGWRIPKGSIIFANSWGILRSEEYYKEPGIFRPERFLGENPEADPAVSGAFGFGRRVCPGRLLAENMLWLESACLLAAFTFSHAKDQNGKIVDIRYATTAMPGFILHPPEFPCSMNPRSKNVKRVIQETESF